LRIPIYLIMPNCGVVESLVIWKQITKRSETVWSKSGFSKPKIKHILFNNEIFSRNNLTHKLTLFRNEKLSWFNLI